MRVKCNRMDAKRRETLPVSNEARTDPTSRSARAKKLREICDGAVLERF
jgi:hypothetical protein